MGCTSLPSDPDERRELMEANDPLEPVNRFVFAFNQAVDVIILHPMAAVYDGVVPEPGKKMVHNFITNLKLPFTFVNDVLQGRFDRAGEAAGRFAVNTVAGIGGLADVATPIGLPYHQQDMGLTFAAWGADEGPYLVLPVLGPSNIRDALGIGVQYFVDPVNITARVTDTEDLLYARAGVEAVERRARVLGVMEDLQRRSVDYYAALRSLYRQSRQEAVRRVREKHADGAGGKQAAMEAPAGGTQLAALPPDAPARSEVQTVASPASASRTGTVATGPAAPAFHSGQSPAERGHALMRAATQAVANGPLNQ